MKYFKTLNSPNRIISINFSRSVKVADIKFVSLCLPSIELFFLKFIKIRGIDNPKMLETFSCNIAIVGSKKMQRINFEHRLKDYSTDVLSFPSMDWINMKKKELRKELLKCGFCLGDIVICKEKLKDQAIKYKISEKEEFIHLLVHGFLHLLGYDHEISDKDARLMQGLEKKILDGISSQKGIRKFLLGRL